MQVNAIEVSKNILNWISQSLQLSDDSLCTLAQWESGEKKPTFNQLEKFSKKIRIPIGYFFLNTPPTESLEILEFRTIDSVSVQSPSRELKDTVRQMENIQEWMKDYIKTSRGNKLSFVGSLNKNDSVQNIANNVRSVLSLPINWFEKSQNIISSFKTIKTAISSMGIIVMMNGIVGANTRRKLNVEEFRAFALVDDFVPLIFINSSDSKSAMLFSLLHEFVHIGIGESSFFNAGYCNTNYINPNEIFCNAVAAEVLVPISTFQSKWSEKNNDIDILDKINNLASYYKCSQVVIARRALDNQLISIDDYNVVVNQAKQGNKKKLQSGGGDYYKTNATRIDHKFLLSLDASLREGKTLFTDAFRLTNTNRSTFETLVREIRGERL